MRTFSITVNGKVYEVQVEEIDHASTPAPQQAPLPTPSKPAAVKSYGTPVTAPMPGTIVAVRVTFGQLIKKGDILVILEAMKMENEILAERDGTVTEISVSKGSTVNSGDPLLYLT